MLILASQSVARKSLLAGAGLRFEASPAPIDERAVERAALGKSPGEIARLLAEAKALAVAALNPAATVIGADQTLSVDGGVLHKPPDLHAARMQLDCLAGRTHTLSCGIALARGDTLLWSDAAEAHLTMRAFTALERDSILDEEGAGVLNSVGAYRLEGPSIRLFERVDGDYFTILGLPLLPLLAALRRFAPETLKGFT